MSALFLSAHVLTAEAVTTTYRSPIKMVEMSQQANSAVRPRTVPVSSNTEELVINQKLQTAAEHYTKLIAWQLQQQREFYEEKLNRIKRNIETQASNELHGGGSRYTHLMILVKFFRANRFCPIIQMVHEYTIFIGNRKSKEYPSGRIIEFSASEKKGRARSAYST